ncbi:MAG: formate dehydrogenase accessory protein FdhE [Candidatus Caldarchaeum sp.]|uniref:Formate dehydrogenase accessory protein FdhE n=1 Tax=Caldiarchaeum subterraneum TaxID=311458 RepID=A0A7C5QK69_CALS0
MENLDVIAARLKRLESQYELVRFLKVVIALRNEVLQDVDAKEFVMEGFNERVASNVARGERPFLDDEVLNKINYRKYSETLLKLLEGLRAAGLGDGVLTYLINSLSTEPDFSKKFLRSVLLGEKMGEQLSMVSLDVFRVLALAPLHKVLKAVNKLNSRLDAAVFVRGCLTCGSPYSLAVYRSGFKHLVCAVCGNVVRVDFFYCPNCGSTDPKSMRFLASEEEPFLQLDVCDRCNTYRKVIIQDIIGVEIDDHLLLEAVTKDLDALAADLLKKD